MTDNEIIKALERCGQHRECCYCNSVEECGSKRVLADNCLDLINRQKAEIDILIRKKESLRDEISDLKAEVERLKKEVEVKSQKRANFFEIIDAHEKGRARAIKEFAERLKEMKLNKQVLRLPLLDLDIDNLVKEMTERKE